MRTHDSAPPSSASASPPRRIRRDGWTTDRQVKFIIALNRTGSVTRAAAAAGMSRESAYRLRGRRGHGDFARAWNAAVARKGHKPAAESHTAGGRAAPVSLAKVTKVTPAGDSSTNVHLVHFAAVASRSRPPIFLSVARI